MKQATRFKKLLNDSYSPKKSASFALELNGNVHKETLLNECEHLGTYALNFDLAKAIFEKCGKKIR